MDRTVLGVEGQPPHAMFGSSVGMKFGFSMILFMRTSAADERAFGQALDRYCVDRADRWTLALL